MEYRKVLPPGTPPLPDDRQVVRRDRIIGPDQAQRLCTSPREPWSGRGVQNKGEQIFLELGEGREGVDVNHRVLIQMLDHLTKPTPHIGEAKEVDLIRRRGVDLIRRREAFLLEEVEQYRG